MLKNEAVVSSLSIILFDINGGALNLSLHTGRHGQCDPSRKGYLRPSTLTAFVRFYTRDTRIGVDLVTVRDAMRVSL